MLKDPEEQHKGFSSLGRAMWMCRMDEFPGKLIPHLFEYLFLEKEVTRKDYAAFFAEFIGRPFQKKEKALMERIFFGLKVLLNDHSSLIQLFGIRGICNAAPNLPQKEGGADFKCLPEIYKRFTLSDLARAMDGILKTCPAPPPPPQAEVSLPSAQKEDNLHIGETEEPLSGCRHSPEDKPLRAGFGRSSAPERHWSPCSGQQD
ncbi:uncharacterized protein M6D78_017024 [Vipera latastei]